MERLNDIRLRVATAADIPIIVAIIHAAFKEYAGLLDPPSGAHNENAANIREKLTTEHALLGLRGDQIVACVFYRDAGEHIYFGRLAVLPAYRGRGIAGVLIDHVEARARELGLPSVRLGVRVALPDLRARYERRGYRVIAEHCHAGYAVTTYLVMEKALELKLKVETTSGE